VGRVRLPSEATLPNLRDRAFQQQKADHDFVAQEEELHVNTQLTRQVERLTREIHGAVLGTGSESGSGSEQA